MKGAIGYQTGVKRLGIVLLMVAGFVHADELGRAKSLLRKKDPQSLIRGARMVRDMGSRGKRAAPLLVKHLAHKDPAVRRVMNGVLVMLGSDAVPLLIKTLKRSKNVTQRREIAVVLFKMGPDASKYADDMVDLLGDADEPVRQKLAEAVAGFGAASLPLLVEALTGKSDKLRAGAATAFSLLGTQAYQPALAALANKSPSVRAAAADILGNLGPKAAGSASALRSLLKDSHADVRLAAVRALGRVKADPEPTLAALVPLLADPDTRIVQVAVESLAQFGDVAAPALIEALGGAGGEGALLAIVRIGEPAIAGLEPALEAEQPAMRARAVRALSTMGPFVKRDLASMQTLLDDDDAAVRIAAADALARCAAVASTDELLLAATDADAGVRAAVVRALGHAIPNEQVIETVNAAAADKHAVVKLAAAGALWQLGRPSTVLALARDAIAGTDAQLRATACRAIAPMGRAAESLLPVLIAAAQANPGLDVVEALGAITAAHGNGLIGRAERYKRAPAATRKSIDAALDWLRRFQDTRSAGKNSKDGRWDPQLFVKHDAGGTISGAAQSSRYGVGVTGLALSAFLATGRAGDPAVREGLAFLVESQRTDGLFTEPVSLHFLIDHAFATVALCEAWIVTGNPRYREAARRAVAVCIASRNPNLAWRYQVRGKENDTNVTAIMLTALALAERGGLEVDAQAFVGGGRWLRSMTDGLIGYNVPGSTTARTAEMVERFPPEFSGAMTAAGLWGFSLARRHGVRPPKLTEALDWCRDLPPRWERGHIDMYYWYYGTLAFFMRGGEDWKKWQNKLVGTLLPHQHKKSGVFAGSWDPDGVWGPDGGRVYSTAISALSLATPYRFSSEFGAGKPTGVYAEAAKALATLAAGENKRIAARARVWLTRAGG